MIPDWIIATDLNGLFHVIRIDPDRRLGPFGTVREAEQAIDELVKAGNKRLMQ